MPGLLTLMSLRTMLSLSLAAPASPWAPCLAWLALWPPLGPLGNMWTDVSCQGLYLDVEPQRLGAWAQQGLQGLEADPPDQQQLALGADNLTCGSSC